MPTPIPHNVPSGGFHVFENGEKFTGYSVDDLSKQLASYRRLNNLLIGNPKGDVEDYICRHNPADCFGTGQAHAASPDGYETIVVTQWADSFQDDPPLVDAPTAQRRAKTGCIGCPHNKPYGCCQNKQPKGVFAGKLASLREGKDVNRYGTELFSCSALGIDNRAGVWIDAKALHVSQPLPPLPARCWVPDAIQADNSPNYP